jgi:hypothetical protein
MRLKLNSLLSQLKTLNLKSDLLLKKSIPLHANAAIVLESGAKDEVRIDPAGDSIILFRDPITEGRSSLSTYPY